MNPKYAPAALQAQQNSMSFQNWAQSPQNYSPYNPASYSMMSSGTTGTGMSFTSPNVYHNTASFYPAQPQQPMNTSPSPMKAVQSAIIPKQRSMSAIPMSPLQIPPTPTSSSVTPFPSQPYQHTSPPTSQAQMSPMSFTTHQLQHMSFMNNQNQNGGFALSPIFPADPSALVAPSPTFGTEGINNTSYATMYSPMLASAVSAVKIESPPRDDEEDDAPSSVPDTPGKMRTDKKTRKTSRAESQAPYTPNGADLRMSRQLRKNTREKQRRLELNDQFESLCNLLHLGANNKAEKFTILSQAIDVISTLRQENIDLRREKTELRAEMGKLAQQLHAVLPTSASSTSSSSTPATAATHPATSSAASTNAPVVVKHEKPASTVSAPVPSASATTIGKGSSNPRRPAVKKEARDPFLEDVLAHSDLQSDVLADADLEERDVFDDEVTPNDEDVFGEALETNSMDDELI